MTERKNLKIKVYGEMASKIAELSTCHFLKVGAVLLTENWEVISLGYNGTIGNIDHCCDVNKEMSRADHLEYQTEYELHAEFNCIRFARGSNLSLQNSRIFITHSPCQNCLKQLASIGVKEVYYLKQYRRVPIEKTRNQAENLGITLYRVEFNEKENEEESSYQQSSSET